MQETFAGVTAESVHVKQTGRPGRDPLIIRISEANSGVGACLHSLLAEPPSVHF